MSQDLFLQLMLSNEFRSLLKNNLSAFGLLVVIADRAKRTDKPNGTGLKKGEARIGDYKNYGMTRGQYRFALEFLEKGEYIIAKRSTKGTIAKIIDDRIFKLNLDINERRGGGGVGNATNSRPTDDQLSSHLNDQQHDQQNNQLILEENLDNATNKTTNSTTNSTTNIAPIYNHQTTTNKELENKEYNKKNTKKEFLVPTSAMCADFYSSLLKARPDFNPNKLKSSKSQLAAMERLLKAHGEEKVRKVWEFAHTDWFWIRHVHTPCYLATKFETLRIQMEAPLKKAPTNNRDKVLGRFKHDQIYNGARCYINGETVAFERGMTHHQIRFNEAGFDEQFENILRKFQITKEHEQQIGMEIGTFK